MDKTINPNNDSLQSIFEKKIMLRDSKLNNLKLSVIICTMNRHESLELTFNSISNSSIKPHKIIIIDDSNDNLTEEVVNKWQSLITDAKFIYKLSNSKTKSLTKARNIGINYINDSDIVLFLDDDVILDKKYIEEISKIFLKDPKVAGCQGFIECKYKNKIFKFILCLVGLILPPLISASFFTPSVSRTMETKYPIFTPRNQKIKECQWLSGANMAYRSDIFKNDQFRFDENFISYCLSEDLEFSYRLFKIKKKLVINFDAKLVHRVSQEFRKPRTEVLLMRFGYKKYLIHKFVSKNLLGDMYYYIYSYRLLLAVLLWAIFYKRNIEYFKEWLKAYLNVRLSEKDIKNLDLNSLNKLIISQS